MGKRRLTVYALVVAGGPLAAGGALVLALLVEVVVAVRHARMCMHQRVSKMLGGDVEYTLRRVDAGWWKKRQLDFGDGICAVSVHGGALARLTRCFGRAFHSLNG